MKIKDKTRIIENGCRVVSVSGHLLYDIDGCTYCDHHQILSDRLWIYPEGNHELYASSNDRRVLYRINLEAWMAEEVLNSDGIVRLGVGQDWFVWSRWCEDEGTTYTLESAGKIVWQITTAHLYITRLGDYALLWNGFEELESRCQLIALSSGSVIWEIDHPGAYIKQVYPYEDKVIIVWVRKLPGKGKNRVLCVEVPSGKVLWENDTAGAYHKYGEDKLVCFISFYRNEGEEDNDNHSYAEIDVQTGSVYMHKYPGYRSSVERNYVYKDFLFYTSARGDAYIGAIDLRTHKMIDEVMIDFTPGDFNQTKGLGIYAGQLYVEVQTELDHSDIHVFDLDEGE